MYKVIQADIRPYLLFSAILLLGTLLGLYNFTALIILSPIAVRLLVFLIDFAFALVIDRLGIE